MDSSSYQPPVSQLLTYGSLQTLSDWVNYSQEFGLTSENIPELIRLATDLSFNDLEEESPEVWAPLHAWRALSEFGAASVSAVSPLIELLTDLEDDDYFREDLPKVMARIGPLVIPEIEKLFHYNNLQEIWRQGIIGTDCLEAIAKEHPESRSRIFEIAIQQLENYRHNDPGVNGFLICLLCDLENSDALPLIEKAFFEGKVDVYVVDWEDVQIAFDINEPAPSRESIREFMKIQPTERVKPKGFAPSKESTPQTNKSKKKSKS